MRSPLAKARDNWLSSAEGVSCADPSILRHREHGVYLTNRLVEAFLAGADWMERQKQKGKRHNSKINKQEAD